MISVFGYSIQLAPGWELLNSAYGSFLVTMIAWVAIAVALYLLLTYAVRGFTRRLPGEIEDVVLEILRKPLLIGVVALGTVNSLEILPLSDDATLLLERVFKTILVLIVVHALWWLVKDVLVYYGSAWAKRTESSLDDILIPTLTLFGPLIILINGGLVIFPIWGVDVSSVLVGAGVVGLVLGLALQEPLSNVFSGLSLLIESPFRTGDLIMFGDGKVGEVERLGLRSIQIYSLDDHSTVYLPNKALSSGMIMNITKPTVEQKYAIAVTIGADRDMARVRADLKRIAQAHPNVVMTDVCAKLHLLEDRVAEARHAAEQLADAELRMPWLRQIQQLEQAMAQLDLEDQVNARLAAFQSTLLDLLPAIRQRKDRGLTAVELADLHTQYVAPAQQIVNEIVQCAQTWSEAPDPWINADEQNAQRELWQERNRHLLAKWRHLEQALSHPEGILELRLDDLTQEMIQWLRKEYKILPEEWKNPEVTFKEFSDADTRLQLWFYVDNVRLERYLRGRRVVTEVAQEVREYIKGTNAPAPLAPVLLPPAHGATYAPWMRLPVAASIDRHTFRSTLTPIAETTMTTLTIDDLAARPLPPARVVEQARADDALLQALLQGISPEAKKKTLRENSSQALLLLGQQHPERLLPHWNELVALLKSDNGFTKYVVIYVITALVEAHPQCNFDAILNTYFRLLDDESVMVASHVAGTAGRIARARPPLQSKITRRLLAVDKTHFDAGRQGLVASYALTALDEYFAESPDQTKILAFVRKQLTSPSPRARAKARTFFKRWQPATARPAPPGSGAA